MSDIKINEVISIVGEAGGRIVGRTRLQKVAYLLTATGLDDNFKFIYKHYGPYSGDLASSAQFCSLIGNLTEEKAQTQWGAVYSTYTVDGFQPQNEATPRSQLATIAANSDSIELELAATAVFLAREGYDDPWGETSQRKPEKVTQARIQNAKALLAELSQIPVPSPIPASLYT